MGVLDLSSFNSSTPLVTIEIDPGIDDLVALIVMIGAHKLGLLKILALICSNGNMDLVQGCENTKIIMDHANVDSKDIPLFYGVKSATYREVEKDYYFGKDGLGDINETSTPIKAKPRHIHSAAEFGLFLHQQLSDLKRGVTLMSLGSLTFTATVLLQQPDLNVEGIWIMGGNDLSVKKGEWNIFVDPEAAHYILRSNISKVTVVNYQDCLSVKTPMKWRNYTLGNINTPIIQLLNLSERGRRNQPIWEMFDPVLAVAFVDQSAVREFKHEYVQVNLDHGNASTYGLFIPGPWKIRLIKGLHQNKFQTILENTAERCM